MKITFISNGTHQMVITPENEEDKFHLALVSGGSAVVKESFAIGESISKDCLVITKDKPQTHP